MYPLDASENQIERFFFENKFTHASLHYHDALENRTIELKLDRAPNVFNYTFDLSNLGTLPANVFISTGYRKSIKPENAGKNEVWLCPLFLLRENILGNAKHYKTILEEEENLQGIHFAVMTNKGEDQLDKFRVHFISGDVFEVNWPHRKAEMLIFKMKAFQ